MVRLTVELEYLDQIEKLEAQVSRLEKKLTEIHEITQDTTLSVPCWQKLQNIEATAASALGNIEHRPQARDVL